MLQRPNKAKGRTDLVLSEILSRVGQITPPGKKHKSTHFSIDRMYQLGVKAYTVAAGVDVVIQEDTTCLGCSYQGW